MPVLRLMAGFAVLIIAGGCEGERIRLGDGPLRVGEDAGGSSLGGDSVTVVDEGQSEAGELNCELGETAPDEVLWIGDTWLTIPGNQRTGVQDYARASGALGAMQEYDSLAAAAAGMEAIVNQYRTRQSAKPVKVIIMDGGTWDTILLNGSDESVERVLNTFAQFLEEVSRDGSVEQIIYMLCPELPAIKGVAALRPGLVDACGGSQVPCHFLDLEPLWAGHPEYTAPDGIQASEAGGRVIADEIWRIMQDNCIAQ